MKEPESLHSQFIPPRISRAFHPHDLIESDFKAAYASAASISNLSRKRRHSDTEPCPISDKRPREVPRGYSYQLSSAEDLVVNSQSNLNGLLEHEAEEYNNIHFNGEAEETLEDQALGAKTVFGEGNPTVGPEGDRIVLYERAGGTPIYLHEQLATNLRSHQIDALQFLWKEVAVAASTQAAGAPKKDENAGNSDYDSSDALSGGALLAHTMGLGKTVTVIAFLFMLAEAQGPVPERTAHPMLAPNLRVGQHMARILILVPGGLLTNWALELKTWAAKFTEQSSCGAKLLNTVYRIRNTLTLEQRLGVLKKWHKSGGILLLGYELFRILVSPKDSSYRPNHVQSQIDGYLLEPGAQVVVADEAHSLKNTQSKITRAAREISTRNRIALTASPLSNNLLEFYSLMSWISPESALGESLADFRTNFYNPIMNGLSQSEEDSDVKSPISNDEEDQCEPDDALETAKRTLQDIINVSAGKIHRRNVETIKQYLEPKTEFIIRVSLNDKQVSLYNNYIEESTNESAMWRSFCLRALCNHPEVFLRIRKRGVGKKRAPEGKIKAPVTQIVGPENLKTCLQEEKLKTMATFVLPSPETEGHQPTGLLQSQASHAEDTNCENPNLALKSTYLPKIESKSKLHTVKITDLTASIAKTILTASNKFLILFHLLEGFKAIGDKALIFSHSIDTLNLLYTLATTLGFSVLRLDGSVHFHQRQEDLVKFNRGVYDIYLVSTKAGGIGLNLQCANRVIILDNDHCPLWEHQATGRAYRMGQTKEVFVYRFLVEGSIETKIAREKQTKVRLSNIVVDGIWEKRKSYGMDTDNRNVWDHAQKVKVPTVLKNTGLWRGRDTVLDQVVEGVHVITDITVDTYETTSLPPAALYADITDYGANDLIEYDLTDVELELADEDFDDISTDHAQIDTDYEMTDNE